MKFGVYFREKREQKRWTQPEAAAKAGIEQSYLSKLETGKSYPSEDIFKRLVEIYEIDTCEMTEQLTEDEIEKLKEISEIRQLVLTRRNSEKTVARSWLVAGLLSLMVGGASLGLSLPSENTYQFKYRSEGVILSGEPLEIFSKAYDNSDTSEKGLQIKQKMVDRIDQQDVVFSESRGGSFIENVEGGKRLYEKYAEREVRGKSSPWLLATAFAFLTGSFGCFLIGFRWR